MNKEKTFIELVQLHERAWGTETYPNRPDLNALLTKPVVVMWVTTDPKAKDRYLFSVHDNANELNDMVTGMITLTRTNLAGSRKISKIFIQQQSVKFGVKIAIEKPK